MQHVAWSKWKFGANGLITPNGCEWSARELESRAFLEAENRHDFGGEWAGWKTRGRWLIAPGGKRTLPKPLVLFLEGRTPCEACEQRRHVEQMQPQLQLPFTELQRRRA